MTTVLHSAFERPLLCAVSRCLLALCLLLAGCGSGGPEGDPIRDQLLMDLQATAAETRIRAVLELGRRREAAATPGLIKCLSDIRLDVKKAAAVALGRVGSPDAVPALCAIVKTADTDQELRRLAADALGQIASPAAVPTLADGLRDPIESLAFSCAYALGRIGEPALGALIEALEKGSPAAQRAAAAALGQIPHERTRKALRPLLKSPDPSLRLSAAENLAQLGDKDSAGEIVALLLDADETVRRGIPRALPALGLAAAQPLCQVLAVEDRALTRTGPGGAKETIGMEPLHRAALAALTKLSGPEVVRPLVLATGVDLRDMPDTARDHLRAQLQREDARAELFRIVGEGTPRERSLALSALLGLLEVRKSRKGEPDEREAALRQTAIAEIRKHADLVAQQAQAQERGVRRTAATVLCAIGDARGKTPLMAELSALLERLRNAPRETTKDHRGEDVHKTLAPQAENILAALRPVADKDMARQLLPLLADTTLEDRVWEGLACRVVRILEGAPDAAYVDTLLKLFEGRGGKLRGLTQPLIRTLGAIGDPRPFDTILKLTKAMPNDSYFAETRLISYRALLRCDLNRGYEYVAETMTKLKPHVIAQIEGIARLMVEFPDARAVLPLVQWVNHDIDLTQEAVRNALTELGKKDLTWLVAGFETESSAKRSSLAGVIADGFGAAALPEMLKTARGDRPRLRQGAVWALGCLGGEQAVAAIGAALKDEAPGVRAAAAWSVGKLKERSLADAVLALLKDPDPAPRSMAAQQLAVLGGPSAVAPLIAALRDDDPQVRAYAAISLADLRATEALKPVEELLAQEKDADVKKALEFAVQTLRGLAAQKR